MQENRFSSYFNTLKYYEILNESGCINQKNDWFLHLLIVGDKHSKIIQCKSLKSLKPYSNKNDAITPFFIRHFSNDDFSHDDFCLNHYEKVTKNIYYPKIQLCLPYVPIEGDKLIFNNMMNERNTIKMYSLLLAWAKHKKYNSIHVTLPKQQDYKILKNIGFFSSQKQLCYWYNKSYKNFDDFLNKLKSKYRCQIKKERTHIEDKGYLSHSVTGNELKKSHIDLFWQLFELTHYRKNWIMSKLNKQFFYQAWLKSPNHIVLNFLTKDKKTVAVSWSFLHENMLCGRFWGSLFDHDYVHFEVMYYLLIDYAIKHNLNSIEIGFANLHKIIRGFEPQSRCNFHYFFDDKYNQDLKNYSVKHQNYKNIFLQ
ncbi:MAG TPA: GNAT family N-acetyltransferase [Oligoflexia bacterium]|nr:GNAT family N-acetyltransferase [Oligoflexia bacterium]HMR23863.1 GNAT family N-acetyltransferase [Oligoflexia bacterium]